MPFESHWYVPRAVIYSRFTGATTEEDIVRHAQTLDALIAESDRPQVHVLVDSSAVTKPLPFTATIRAVRVTPSNERAGWVVTVGEQDPMIKFISDMARQIMKLRTRNFKTRDEALDFLKDIDDTVDWSQAHGDVLTSGST